jgi:hypothetical protein
MTQGSNEEILAAAYFKMFFEFLQKKGIVIPMSPIKASKVMKKIQMLVKYFVIFFQQNGIAF